MNKIFARNTTLIEIQLDEAQSFVKQHHRQGAVGMRSVKMISLGLYHNNILVAVAQFGSPRTSAMKKRYSIELLRLAFPQNIRIIGGASKLIKGFIKSYSPADLFTYQSMNGEQSDVYLHAGLKLVETKSIKEYFVAPNKTIHTAGKQEIVTMGYAVKLGPDKLLGTLLGEVYKSDGKRKTNPQIFIEDLGWHLETGPGDRIYEWVDSRTYYAYKITAADSQKYYFGVSHVKHKNATFKECSDHQYFGSGGVKYQKWKNRHQELISKEVLKLFDKRLEAFKHEILLIGESYKRDQQCLNSKPGGLDGGIGLQKSISSKSIVLCEKHGLTVHQANSCCKCASESRFKLKTCEIHGEVNHIKSGCWLCSQNNRIQEKHCNIHGLTAFKGKTCCKCVAKDSVKMQNCSIHGLTKFIGTKCYKCISDGAGIFTSQLCETHGMSTFRKMKCVSCNIGNYSQKICEVHGETLFMGDRCLRCKNGGVVKTMNCEVHGPVKTQGKNCPQCFFSIKECDLHGLTKFRITTNACVKCEFAKRKLQKLQNCDIIAPQNNPQNNP